MDNAVNIHSGDTRLTALVTGASSGIGLEFTRQLAAQGCSVVMVSNQTDELAAARDALAAEYPTLRFWAHYKDLTEDGAAGQLLQFCHDNALQVDVLVNNAGIFLLREVNDTTPERLDTFIDLHVRAVTQLCRLFGAEMSRRGCGYILNMSSMSCWMPAPGIAMYAATKAYLRVFTRSLRLELHDCGVHVMAACPGGIATTLFGLPPHLLRLGVRLGVLATPQAFVSGALRRLFAGRKQYVNGIINRLAIVTVSSLPDWLKLIIKHKLLDKYVKR